MKRHPLDWVSLIAGAVFLIIAVGNVVEAATDTSIELGWLIPASLIALGAAGLAGVLRGGRERGAAPRTGRPEV